MYIPNKPAKYGVKIFALVCAKSMYTLNLEVYTGKQPDGSPLQLSNSAEDVVLRMVKPIEGTNRNVTGDNWFTSISLTERLLTQKKLTYVGTIQQIKRQIPQEFRPNAQREIYSSLFGFRKDMTLVSYCPKKKNAVLVLSSMHHDKEIDSETGELQKPAIVTFYNHTKVGVDVLDQMCAKYDVARCTKRWPMVVFFDLLNISAINASRVHTANHNYQPTPRRKFLEVLAWELMKPQIAKRATLPMIPAPLRRRAKVLLEIEEEPIPLQVPDSKVGRCYICGRAKDKSTRKSCVRCRRKVCPEHSALVCRECLDE